MAASVTEKYPPGTTVTKLSSTYEIKQSWLYHEWTPECQFHRAIRPSFPSREALDPNKPNPNVALVVATFEYVRGKYGLWQAPREEGRWKRVDVENLPIDWVKKNVEVLYPSQDRFPVSSLSGIVLWKDKSGVGKKYKLHEGNHRISAWLAAETPASVKATLYIGKPKRLPAPPATTVLV